MKLRTLRAPCGNVNEYGAQQRPCTNNHHLYPMQRPPDTPATLRRWIDEAVDRANDDLFAVVETFEGILERIRAIVGERKSSLSPTDLLLLLEHTAERAFHFAETESQIPTVVDALDSSLVALHHEICSRLEWEPERLADYLFRLALTDTGFFITRITRVYDDVLGARGLAAYRALLAAAVHDIPIRRPADAPWFDQDERRVLRLVPDLENDPAWLNAYLEGRSKNRSTQAAYGAAIELYADHGRRESAVELIRQSLDWFGDELSPSLLERFRSLLIEAGQHETASEIAWRIFTHRNPLYGFQILRESVGSGWKESTWRARALDHIRSRVIDDSRARSGFKGSDISRSGFIDLLLGEGEIEEAWQEALSHDCSRKQWLALAEALAPSRPDDAVAIYAAHIESLEPRTGLAAYEEVVTTLTSMRDALSRHGRVDEFLMFLSELKERLARRRKLIDMIDERFGASFRRE